MNFEVLSFVPFMTRRYEVEKSFVIKNKLCNGRLTQQQTKALKDLDKPWLIPELVRNPLYLH